MVLLAGSVRFASPDGSMLPANTGDAIFVPRGAPIGWGSSERAARFYAVQALRAGADRSVRAPTTAGPVARAPRYGSTD